MTTDRTAWIAAWMGETIDPLASAFMREFAASTWPLTDRAATEAWCRFNLHGHGSLLG